MKHRLTDGLVKRLPVPEKGNRVFYDSLVNGFGLRVTAGGDRSFVLNYRIRSTGKERRYTIGNSEQWQATQAREQARELKRGIDAGADPLADIEAERGAPTIADLAARYEEVHLPRKRERSREEDLPLIRIITEELGPRKITEVKHGEIDALHRKVTKERGPYRANRVLAVLSKMFSLAVKWEWRANNPCIGVEKNPEHKRNRFLTPDELARLTVALAAERDQEASNVARLLLMTGARCGEVLAAEWSQFDLDAGLWVKPHSATKQAREHRVPLSAPALALLVELKNGAAKRARYVFPADGGHRADIRHAWDRIREAAGLGDFRIHDLRHSYASFLASAGLSLPVIGALLGHTEASTTQRYAHLLDDPLRQATEHVGALVAGKPSAEVRPFKRGA